MVRGKKQKNFMFRRRSISGCEDRTYSTTGYTSIIWSIASWGWSQSSSKVNSMSYGCHEKPDEFPVFEFELLKIKQYDMPMTSVLNDKLNNYNNRLKTRPQDIPLLIACGRAEKELKTLLNQTITFNYADHKRGPDCNVGAGGGPCCACAFDYLDDRQ